MTVDLDVIFGEVARRLFPSITDASAMNGWG